MAYKHTSKILIKKCRRMLEEKDQDRRDEMYEEVLDYMQNCEKEPLREALDCLVRSYAKADFTRNLITYVLFKRIDWRKVI